MIARFLKYELILGRAMTTLSQFSFLGASSTSNLRGSSLRDFIGMKMMTMVMMVMLVMLMMIWCMELFDPDLYPDHYQGPCNQCLPIVINVI